MATVFTYTISADVPALAVNTARLHREIVASAISETLSSVRVDDDTLTLTFALDLSAAEETILDNDTTAPSGGIIGAHDASANKNIKLRVAESSPITTSVNAPEGSLVVFGNLIYSKLDDGDSTNLELVGKLDVIDDESGGTKWNFVPFSSDPGAPNNNDIWLNEDATNGSVELLHFDGTNAKVIAVNSDPYIAHIYASTGGAVDIITPGTPENLCKGSTLADAGQLGVYWTIVNAGADDEGLQYIGDRTKLFRIDVVTNLTADEDGNVLVFEVSKNSVIDTNSGQQAELTTGITGITMVMQFIVSMSTNDTVELMLDVVSNSAAGTPIVTVETMSWIVTPL